MKTGKENNEKTAENLVFLPVKEVSVLVGYTADYITRLAREGKVVAEQRGRQWFVNPDSAKLFSLHAEAEKRQRKEDLRQERLRERSEKNRPKFIDIELVTPHAGLELVIVVILLLAVLGLGGVAMSEGVDNTEIILDGLQNVAGLVVAGFESN